MRTLTRTGLAALVAATLATAAGPAAAETVLRFSNWVPPTHPVSTDIIDKWAANVAEATEGRVTIEVLASPLGKPDAHLDLVRNGVADVGFIVHGYTPERFPLTEGAELPFLADDSMSASKAYWRMHEKFLAGAGEYDGVHLAGLWVHGPAHIFMRDKEIATLDDLANQKIRVGGGMPKKVAEKLGAVPFFAPASQSYEVISKGVADGIFFPTESVWNFKIGPAIGYAVEVPGGLYRSSQGIVINQAKWDALPEEDKAAIMSVSGDAMAVLAATMWDTQDALGREKLIEGGTKFTIADGELLAAIRERLAPLEEEWITAGDGKVDRAAALAYLKEQIAAEMN